ncbi:HAD-superfamily hydrolase, subfamily IA, variant 3 [Azotobacter vinelandii CA]|uniref:HAD-superfamily hydrolase, subfamily IA, variant 3 n=2 Tax=Azotobacter vinelandii TaxID=354 RepID=C1DPE3_AZOVD|nr:HAD-IA family hydrolase [Azotobacter vinelandii]ACO77375.1 HAD-superfamily hydrolase, subfamily IA, variant 3 [Azotobacter vinelandii DJ]AGK17072.1 HAD-superfamily hydrolase, subfamily IA, variant 3 [Azotobacter vinelandii CA]AGK19756.1 HAD-superfamily hydrolase, subfamily IA, variant 3 [Azotobacter vinelandii CA6]WKN23043.1 HAD-IA family hydrolase [Azotobacter vinelandii]SFX85118.1 haloacid dehalogenase superfamily, subfamily IA, variant 3 with third motif having DD or ED [Azotobacter vine
MTRTSHIDLLICDCDGVLIDSEIITGRVVREALAALVPEHELDVLLAGTFGLQSRDIIARVAAHFGLDLPADFHPNVRRRAEAIIRAEVQAIPHVREALCAIDLPLAVASNSQSEAVHYALQRTGLTERVDVGVFGADLVKRPKPAPDLYLLAAGTAGVEPQRCLVVEDSATGATAALTAGMRVIGFLGASHIPPEQGEILRELGVEHLLHDMRELPALVERLRYPATTETSA